MARSQRLSQTAAVAEILGTSFSPMAMSPVAMFLVRIVLLLPIISGYQPPLTAQTGHTGLPYDGASVVTISGYQRLQGAMIPRQCQVGVLVQPSNQDEVIQALKQATDNCKAASGGQQTLNVRASRQLYHAASDILCPSASSSINPACSVALDLEKLSTVVSLDTANQVVTVGPTILLYTLLNYLEPHGLSMDSQYLPFYSNLTIAGMLLTAAHGSSRTKPSVFGEIVTSVTFVDAKGGVHNTTDISPLIGSNGLFGVITQMTVKVVPNYKIKAIPRRVPDKILRATLPKILSNPNLVLIQWLPDVFQAIVMTRQKVPLNTPGHSKFQVLDSQPLVAAAAGPALGIQQVDDALLGNRLLLDDLPICLAEVVLIPYHRSEITRIPVPFGVPAIGRAAVMASSNCVPGPNFGCLWRNIDINLLEIDLDVKILAQWMDDVRTIIRRSVPTCLPSVIGFAMRFGQGTKNPLDMAYGRDTAYVDLVSNKAPWLVDAASSYQHVFDEIELLSYCKYGARPHWGKNSNRVLVNSRCPVADKYPELAATINKTKAFDPQGIFVSPLLQRFINRQSLPKTPGCAIRADCYCDEDVDCGPKYKCVPADTFPEFKVCKSQVLSLKHNLLERVKEGLTANWMG